MEALERKREKQRLLEEEDAKIKGKQTKEAPSKVTRAQIEETLQKGQNVKETKETKEKGKAKSNPITLLQNVLCFLCRQHPKHHETS